jgi:hypothetical protein
MHGTTDYFVRMPWKPSNVAPPDGSTPLVMMGLILCMILIMVCLVTKVAVFWCYSILIMMGCHSIECRCCLIKYSDTSANKVNLFR